MAKSPGFVEKEHQVGAEVIAEKKRSLIKDAMASNDPKFDELKKAIERGEVGGGGDGGGGGGGMMSWIFGVIGGVIGWFASSGNPAGAMAGFSIGWALGGAVGGIIDPPKPPSQGGGFANFSSKSPTYGFQALYNTTSNQLCVPVVYGRIKLAGNHLWMSEPGETIHKFLSIGEGEMESCSDVRVNDIPIGDITGCSHDWFAGTASQTVDGRGSTYVDGLRYTSYLAVTLQSGDKLKGGNPVITAVYEGIKMSTWNGNNWTTAKTYSNNPSACVRDFLTNTRYGIGIPESAIDSASFGDVAEYCDATVDNIQQTGQEKRYTLNLIIDGRQPALDILSAMLSTFGAFLIMSGNKIKIGVERASATVQTFDNDNVIGGSFQYSLAGKDEVPNRVKIQYVDIDYDWIKIFALAEDKINQDERVALGLGEKVIETHASLLGITNFSHASRIANLYLYIGKLCPIYISFKTPLRGLVCEVGDVIELTHACPNWTSKPFRVLKMTMSEENAIEISAREYNSSIYSDTPGQEIQIPDYGDVTPPNQPPDAPDTVVITEDGYMQQDGTWVPVIDAVWTDDQDKTYFSHYIVQWKRGGNDYSTYAMTPGLTIELSPAEVGAVYNVRVSTVNVTGLQSGYTVSNPLTISATSDIPSDVIQASYTFDEQLTTRWTPVYDADLAGYDVRNVDDFWGISSASGLIYRGMATDFVEASPSGVSFTYYIKAFNDSGYFSANPYQLDIINEVPLDVTGFGGTFSANIDLAWDDMNVENDLEYYEIRTADGNWGVSGTTLLFRGFTTNAWDIDPGSTQREKTLYIKAKDVHDQWSVNATSGTFINSAPTAPVLTGDNFFNLARLDWTDVSDIDFKYYDVWESQTSAWAGEEILLHTSSNNSDEFSSPRDFAEGICASGSTDTLINVSGINLSTTNDYYNNDNFFIEVTTGNWETRTVLDYDGATQTATLNSALTSAPSVGQAYHIDNVAWYKVGAVDTFGSGTLSNPVRIDYTQISGSWIGDNVITARMLVAAEIITDSAQIRDATIENLHVVNISGSKIYADSITTRELSAEVTNLLGGYGSGFHANELSDDTADSSYRTLQIDNEVFDRGGEYDTTTYRFTANDTGYYMFYGCCTWEGGTGCALAFFGVSGIVSEAMAPYFEPGGGSAYFTGTSVSIQSCIFLSGTVVGGDSPNSTPHWVELRQKCPGGSDKPDNDIPSGGTGYGIYFGCYRMG